MEHNDCPSNKFVVRAGTIVTGCASCIERKLLKGSSAAGNRRWQQAEYRRALTQPVDARNYIRAYGVEHARKEGFTDEAIRKYS